MWRFAVDSWLDAVYEIVLSSLENRAPERAAAVRGTLRKLNTRSVRRYRDLPSIWATLDYEARSDWLRLQTKVLRALWSADSWD